MITINFYVRPHNYSKSISFICWLISNFHNRIMVFTAWLVFNGKKLSCKYFSLIHVYFRYIILCLITMSNIGWNFRYLSKEKCSFFTKILIEKPSSFSFSPRSLQLFWHAISEIFTFIFTNEHRNTILFRVDISCLLSQILF